MQTDQQVCYKRCGPENVGWKELRCSAASGAVFIEMSGCLFDPVADYSCYKVPTGANAACPAGVTPQHSTPCDVPYCTLCNALQGVPGGSFHIESNDLARLGYCVCQLPNAAGLRTWSCANDSSWPCPGGNDC